MGSPHFPQPLRLAQSGSKGKTSLYVGLRQSSVCRLSSRLKECVYLEDLSIATGQFRSSKLMPLESGFISILMLYQFSYRTWINIAGNIASNIASNIAESAILPSILPAILIAIFSAILLIQQYWWQYC